jgi:two-component system, NarL family, response regulator DegU
MTVMESGALPGTERKSVRLAIVDDHELARDGLRDMLIDQPDFEVVGEAASGQEALSLCSRLHPDIVLMDVRMPDTDGISATKQIKRRHPKISVLMVTMHDNPDYLLEALKGGAAGYVLKDASQDEVVAAVRQVSEGESPLDTALAARLLKRLVAEAVERSPLASRGAPSVEPLTPRELEVLGYTKLGLTNRQIGRELGISPGTVKRHIEHIIAKLGVSDRTQAVVRALELGLLDLSED